MNRHKLLNILIFVGLVTGFAVGAYLFRTSGGDDESIGWLAAAGDLILIRPLKMLIIPLVFVSVVVGITSIGDPSRLGLVGGTTLVYYFATMIIAVVIGTAIVRGVQPGKGLNLNDDVEAQQTIKAEYESTFDEEKRKELDKRQQEGLGGAWMNIARQIVPTNVIAEAAAGNPLPVIAFAILFGLSLGFLGDQAKPVVTFMNGLFDAVMTMVQWVIWLTPIGVFLLIAWSVGKLGAVDTITSLGKYMGCVLVGLLIHALVVLPTILFLFGRANPFKFMWRMRPALLTAFGTDSSSATLPVTMETAETDGECSKRASGFVLPLGSTINMDGTALYEAVAVVFLFQAFGIHLEFEQLLIVVLTATLAAVGAAGIPSAGLVTMVIVIHAVNTSLAGTGVENLELYAIGFIIGVDRILDMCRTTVNVWGDAVGARIITRIAPDTEASAAAPSRGAGL
ncbi:MAG: dicarboxylate/amino acid:cation symporter [Planctomycetes bacterium]|nr:dicarboxylate/amino acid:cation symporter [Planctomycetota bacterium]NOG53982.1 dicarboxylate/amino acid:cation symporter [Planctomycetota bacterium]